MRAIPVIQIFILMFFSCNSNKLPLKVVDSLDVNKYAGKWYEIARLPNSFEKGLECVTANYTLLENGKIEVLNQGHSIADHSKIETAKGKAHIPNQNEPSKLKVTFFWPFYGNYWVIELDKNYQYALVGEPARKYLWILSRTPDLDESSYNQLINIAKEQGFATEKLIKVNQDCQ